MGTDELKTDHVVLIAGIGEQQLSGMNDLRPSGTH